MRIKHIKSQSRRDFVVDYECEHCGHIVEGYGYDDTNFHQNVIPKMRCEKCGKIADENYIPQAHLVLSNNIVKLNKKGEAAGL